jgi:hypothetical protein
MGLTAFGVGFWAFLAIASVAGIVADYRKRQLELEPLRAAIERGVQLDPAVIEKLLTREAKSHSVDPMDLNIGGIITATSGTGVLQPLRMRPALTGLVATVAVAIALGLALQ